MCDDSIRLDTGLGASGVMQLTPFLKLDCGMTGFREPPTLSFGDASFECRTGWFKTNTPTSSPEKVSGLIMGFTKRPT